MRDDQQKQVEEAAAPVQPDTRATAIRLLKEAIPPRWKLYALSIVFILGTAVMTALLANSTKLIVNDVFVANDTSAAMRVALLVILISLGKSLFQYGNSVIQTIFNRSISAGYQKLVFRNLLAKDIWHFDRKHASAQMTEVRMYGQMSAMATVDLSNKLPTDFMILIGLFTVMLLQDPLMTLVSCLLLPIIFLLVAVLSKRIRAISATEAQMTGMYIAIGAEAFSGIKTVKSYGLESKSIRRFDDALKQIEDRLLSIAKVTAATVPIMEFLGGLVIGLFVIYAAWQTINYGKTPGEFTAFITAFLMAYAPAERVSHIWVAVQKSLILVGRMYELLEEEPRRPLGGTRTLDDATPSVTFDEVSFEYLPGAPALHNVSFEIAPHERVAIVGKSGAGKSTLIDLVLRFYDPTSGTVSIGGVSLKEVSEDSLRQTIALISQDVFLFDGTIRENILDGKPDATEEEVLEAARLAALDDLIAAPEGLGKVVGPNGGTVSGGQRQRIGIARALIKRSKIYVFDEATSALDVENERRIMENLQKMQATILFVTHRYSTIRYVDRVIMLSEGRIVGMDAPESIAATSEEFRRLFNLGEKPSAAVPDEAVEADLHSPGRLREA
jgi:ABC-type multidrug transport system fused ATPase/permease subunit